MNIIVSSLLNFAQAYGSGAYGSSTYQDGTVGSGTGAAVGSGAGGLTNTGFAVILVATIACFIIFSALVVRFWRRKKATA